MMGEIKVRGWHVEKQRMFSCEEMVRDQLTLLTDGRFINVHGDSTARSTIFSRDKFIPLRYTGLKDKNGREIYEGDVVRLHFVLQCGYEGEQHQIEGYHEGNVRILPSQGVVINPVQGKALDGYEYQLPHGYKNVRAYRAEVIGNIYENPELLKAVNNA